jgi:hypothetical protein
LEEDGVACCHLCFATPVTDAKKKFATSAFAASELIGESMSSVGATSGVFTLGMPLLSVIDACEGDVQLADKFTTEERMAIGEQRVPNAREALLIRTGGVHLFGALSHAYRAPIAIG